MQSSPSRTWPRTKSGAFGSLRSSYGFVKGASLASKWYLVGLQHDGGVGLCATQELADAAQSRVQWDGPWIMMWEVDLESSHHD